MSECQSLAERVCAAFLDCLLDQIPDVEKNVERARADPLSFDETPWINIERGDEESRRHGESADDNEMLVDVEIAVRADQTVRVWETKADALAVQAHRLLLAYSKWPSPVARIRKIASKPLRDEADGTAGKLTLTYAVRYLSSAFELDRAPTQP